MSFASPPSSTSQPRKPATRATRGERLEKVAEVSASRRRSTNPSSAAAPATVRFGAAVTPDMELTARIVDSVATAFQHRTSTLLVPRDVDVDALAMTHPPLHQICAAATEALEAFAELELTSSSVPSASSGPRKSAAGGGGGAAGGALLLANNANLSSNEVAMALLSTLGEAAGVVATRTKLLMDLLSSTIKERWSSGDTKRQIPSTFRKNVLRSLEEALAAINDIRAAASSLHDIRCIILSRDLGAGQRLLLDHAANETAATAGGVGGGTGRSNTAGAAGGGASSSSSSSASTNFKISNVPVILVRWMRRMWLPAMKAWREIVRRFDDDRSRVLAAVMRSVQAEQDAQRQGNDEQLDYAADHERGDAEQRHLSEQHEAAISARLADLLRRYREELAKQSSLLAPIALPGSGIEALFAEAIERPLRQHLDRLRRKAALRRTLKRGIETMNITALSQALRDWQSFFCSAARSGGGSTPRAANAKSEQQQDEDDAEEETLLREARAVIARMQTLGRVTSLLTLARQPGRTLREALDALHQASIVVMNEKWFANETQCAMVVAFGERLARCASDEELEVTLVAVAADAAASGGATSSSSSSSFSTPPPPPSAHQQQQPHSSIATMMGPHHDDAAIRRRLDQFLVAQVVPNKFWPVELSHLLSAVAGAVVDRTMRRFLFEQVSSLAKRVMTNSIAAAASSPSSAAGDAATPNGKFIGGGNQPLSDDEISMCRALIAKADAALIVVTPPPAARFAAAASPFAPPTPTTATAAVPTAPVPHHVHDSLSCLRRLVAQHSSRTVKVHYDSNLRLVRLTDAFAFAAVVQELLGALEVTPTVLAERGPIRIRVADEDGDYITVASQSEWELVLKEFQQQQNQIQNNNNNSNGDEAAAAEGGAGGGAASAAATSSNKKMELYLDHNNQQQGGGNTPVSHLVATPVRSAQKPQNQQATTPASAIRVTNVRSFGSAPRSNQKLEQQRQQRLQQQQQVAATASSPMPSAVRTPPPASSPPPPAPTPQRVVAAPVQVQVPSVFAKPAADNSRPVGQWQQQPDNFELMTVASLATTAQQQQQQQQQQQIQPQSRFAAMDDPPPVPVADAPPAPTPVSRKDKQISAWLQAQQQVVAAAPASASTNGGGVSVVASRSPPPPPPLPPQVVGVHVDVDHNSVGADDAENVAVWNLQQHPEHFELCTVASEVTAPEPSPALARQPVRRPARVPGRPPSATNTHNRIFGGGAWSAAAGAGGGTRRSVAAGGGAASFVVEGRSAKLNQL